MDTRCRGGSERPVPQLHKLAAAVIPLMGAFEDLVGFQIEEAQPHRALAHNAFQVALTAASAEHFFRIERDDDMAAFPDTLHCRITPEPNTRAERPNADGA